jgi:hypothetical protein
MVYRHAQRFEVLLDVGVDRAGRASGGGDEQHLFALEAWVRLLPVRDMARKRKRNSGCQSNSNALPDLHEALLVRSCRRMRITAPAG